MGKCVKRSGDDGVMVVSLCQGNAASTTTPLLPVFLPDVASGVGGVRSSFSVDSLTLSGLRVSDIAAVVPEYI